MKRQEPPNAAHGGGAGNGSHGIECARALRVLRTPSDATTDRSAAWTHVRTCVECRLAITATEALSVRLRALGDGSAPPALRERIHALLREQRGWGRSRRRGPGTARRWIWVPVAAAATLLLLLRTPAQSAVTRSLADAARIGLDSTILHLGEPAAAIEQWLEAEVGYDVAVPEIRNAQLVGGRVQQLNGQRGAALVYLLEGRPITYFAVSSEELFGERVRKRGVRSGSADGYEVALWIEDGGARAVAAPMPRNQVVEIAKECRRKAATD